jgi:hypothetical protein
VSSSLPPEPPTPQIAPRSPLQNRAARSDSIHWIFNADAPPREMRAVPLTQRIGGRGLVVAAAVVLLVAICGAGAVLSWPEGNPSVPVKTSDALPQAPLVVMSRVAAPVVVPPAVAAPVVAAPVVAAPKPIPPAPAPVKLALAPPAPPPPVVTKPPVQLTLTQPAPAPAAPPPLPKPVVTPPKVAPTPPPDAHVAIRLSFESDEAEAAETFTARLRQQGYTVTTALIPVTPGRWPGVAFFFDSDREHARVIAQQLSAITGRTEHSRLSNRHPYPQAGTVEVSLLKTAPSKSRAHRP